MTATIEGTEASPAPESPEKKRRFDLWPLLCFIVAMAVYPLQGYDAGLTRDLGVYSYGGQQVADGVAPYVAIVNRAGPLAHLVPGIAAWVSDQVGFDDLYGMRILMTVIAALCVAVSYLLGRDLFRSRLAGIATAAALLSVHGFITYATDGPREKTTLVLFCLLASLATVRRRWATAGCFTALAALTWQPAFLALAAAAFVATVLGQRTGRIKGVAAYIFGGLVPTAITVGFYVAIGQFRVFIDDFLIINAEYTRQTSLITRPGEIAGFMWDAYGWSLAVLVGGLILQLFMAWKTLRGPNRREPLGSVQVALGVGSIVGLLWSLKAFNGFPDAFFLLPQAVVGIGGIIYWLSKRGTSAKVVVTVTVVWALAATGLSALYAVQNRSDSLVGQREDVAAMKALLPSDATWFSVEGPQPLVLAHERNLSRFQLFGNGLIDYVNATYPGGSDGFGEWVADQSPTVITLGGGNAQPEWLRSTIADQYTRVGRTSKWFVWYLNRDLPPETLQAARDALHDR